MGLVTHTVSSLSKTRWKEEPVKHWTGFYHGQSSYRKDRLWGGARGSEFMSTLPPRLSLFNPRLKLVDPVSGEPGNSTGAGLCLAVGCTGSL